MEKKKLFEDHSGNVSSKRVIGTILIACGSALLMGIGIAAIFMLIKDPETALTAGKTLVYTGGALLGVGVVEFFGKKDEEK